MVVESRNVEVNRPLLVVILIIILKRVWEEEQMPEQWEKGEIVPIYKQKGDPLECGNFRGIKLLEHGMKMFLERRLEN